MLTFQYARYLPEVGQPITKRVDKIEALLLEAAEFDRKSKMIMMEVHKAERELTLRVAELWTQNDIDFAADAAKEDRK
jgi:hypothetical protein